MSSRVLVAGYGNIGKRTCAMLAAGGLELVGVVRRTPGPLSEFADLPVYDSIADALPASRPDIFVELIGGVDDAASMILSAIDAGVHVVTANKAVLASRGREIAAAAASQGVSVLAEASVGGAVPVMRALQVSLAGDDISSVLGVWNGTCNYILTRMESDGTAFDDVLAEAQRLGFAEPEPGLDIDGDDSAHKAAVIAQTAFSQFPDPEQIEVDGITNIRLDDIRVALGQGYRPKLIGIVSERPDGLLIYAGPALLPLDHPVARLDGVTNGISIQSDAVGSLFLSGPGAGPGPTAAAVAGDVLFLANGGQQAPREPKETRLSDLDQVEFPFYLRVDVPDQAGVLSEVSGILAQHGISIESMVQPPHEGESVSIHLTTHGAAVGAVKAAAGQLQETDIVFGAVLWMPILDESDD